jgi:hypothetical protein
MDELLTQTGFTWTPEPLTAVAFDEDGWHAVGGTLLSDISDEKKKIV